MVSGTGTDTACVRGRSTVAGAGVGSVWTRGRGAGDVLFGTSWAIFGVGRATAGACTGRLMTEGLVASRGSGVVWAARD